jgi:putative tricarboxylic transport membrane protein
VLKGLEDSGLRRKEMKKYEIIPVIFWTGLSIFMMVLSIRLGLGKFHTPGPGLMPFILGILLLIACFYLSIAAFFKLGGKKEISKEKPGRIDFVKIGLVLFSLFVYALLLEKVGYLITTFLLLIILFRTAGFKRWGSVLIASALAVFLTYFVFTSFGLRFPEGILKLR